MNIRKVAVSIVLLTLVTFAGCVSEPVSDTPEAESNTTTMTLDSLSFPDGTTGERIENGSALVETHSEALADRDYAVKYESVAMHEDERSVTTQTIRHETDSDGETEEWYVDREISAAESESRTTLYANESSVYTKRVSDATSYDVRRVENGGETPNGIISSLTPVLTAGEYRDSRVVSRDGQTFVEYRFAGISNDPTASELKTVANLSGSVLVSKQGVVHRISANLTYKQDGSESNSQLDYRLTQVGGVSVEKPDWVNEAVEQTEAGDDTPVSNRVQIVSGFGSVTEDEQIDDVNFTVMRGAGSGDVDLTSATVEWSGPDTETTLTYGEHATATSFAVVKIKDSNDSFPVLDGKGDRFTLSMNAEAISGRLDAGEVVELRITTESGAVTLYRVNIPQSLEGEHAVTV